MWPLIVSNDVILPVLAYALVSVAFICKGYPPRVAVEAAQTLLENSTSPQQLAGVHLLIDIISKSSGEEHQSEIHRLRATLFAKGSK